MMAVEGPFLAAVIARLVDATFNLAAHGVAVAFAILIESPVIMIMSASTALVTDADSYRKLRNFTNVLNGAVTLAMGIVLIPGVFDTVMGGVVGLPDEVAHLVYGALVILIPWPGTIGYRRFYQGLLIRRGRTRLVAVGTVIRLATMAATAATLALHTDLAGAYVGAAALSAGVVVEAVAARVMARATIGALLTGAPPASGTALDYRVIAAFYYPLALTSFLGLAVQPMLTFFMGRATLPVVSLAVYPVVHALSFLFRAIGLSFQEAAIALLGDRLEHVRAVGRFGLVLGLGAAGGLGLIAFTPLAGLWFEGVSGLSADLAAYARAPTIALVPLPALSVLLSFQRALLVKARTTRPVTLATVVEVLGIAVTFVVLDRFTAMVGVTAAATAFVAGRLGGNAVLLRPCVAAIRGAADRVNAR
jgi:hypothetical protein